MNNTTRPPDESDGIQQSDREAWLASFPKHNPNPVLELDLASGSIHYANPAAEQLLPDLAIRGLQHPVLEGLSELENSLRDGGTDTVRREIAAGGLYLAQSISYIPETKRLRIYCIDITGRKRVDARLHQLVDSSAQGVIFWNTKGEIIEANDAFLDIVGYTREDLEAGRVRWPEMTPPEFAHCDEDALAKLSANGVCPPFEKEYFRKDGSRVPILLGAATLGDNPEEGVCFVIDLTERKRAEAALRKTRAQLNSALAAGSIGTWTWDIANDCLTADEFTARTFSIEADAAARGLPAATYLQAVVEEDQPAVSENLARAIESCGIYDVEYRVRQKSGEVLWLQARGRVEGDANGNAVLFHGAVIDISERKLAAEAVRESEEYFRFLHDLVEATRSLVDAEEIMIVMARMLGEHLKVSRCAYADVEKDGEQFTILHDYTDGCASTVGQYRLSLFGERAVSKLHSGRTLIIRSVESELLPEDGADMFNAIGIQAIITCPLVKSNGLRAMMAVHQTTPRDWKPREIALVEEIVERCWATIERRSAEEKLRLLNAELEQRVTERTAQLESANVELRQGRAELKSLFESLPGLYLVLTPDLTIISVSDAYLQATMTTRDGILGRGLFEVFPDNPDEPDATGVSNLRASLGRVLENGTPDVMAIQKYDVRRPDGVFEEHYWSPVNSPVFGANHQIKYIVHRVEDVTEFVLQKAQAATSGEELGARLQQMEAEVFHSSQKLQTANEQLEAANKELESFSYSVSHDLRAPLRAMDGFSRALLEDFGPQLQGDGQRYLQIIRNSAQKMGNLIDDLLTFSRLSRISMNKRTIDTNALVQSALEELEGQREGRQIDLRLGDLPTCEGDPVLLKQVWINLLSNAFKYSQRREVAVIEIGCTTGGEMNTYFVRDNGAGFDMRYAHKLFGVFQRLHRAEDYEGTGVGLAIVQRVVHRHGGEVWAESAIDQSTTFYFTLDSRNRP